MGRPSEKKTKTMISNLEIDLLLSGIVQRLTPQEREIWNEYKMRMWMLADKARDESHLNGVVFKSKQAQELMDLIGSMPTCLD